MRCRGSAGISRRAGRVTPKNIGGEASRGRTAVDGRFECRDPIVQASVSVPRLILQCAGKHVHQQGRDSSEIELSRCLASHHLIEGRGDAVLIAGTGRVSRIGGLFGRHITVAAKDLAAQCMSIFREWSSQTKINELRYALRGEQDVTGLHIAMNDAAVMSGRKASGNLNNQPRRILPGARSRAVEPLLKRLPLDKLHLDKLTLFIAAEVENPHDIRMVECGNSPRLLKKPPRKLRIPRVHWQDAFERDESKQLDIPRLPNDPHTSFTQLDVV